MMSELLDTEASKRLAARLALVPVDGSLGIRVDGVAEGGVRLSAPIPRWPGRPDLGLTVAVSVLADAACGCATGQAQGGGMSGPTIELRVDHAEVPTPGARRIVAEAAVRHVAGGAGYLTAEVGDDTGRLLARAQGHFVMLPPGAEPEQPMANGPAASSPDELLKVLAGDPGRARNGAEPGRWEVPATPALSNPRNQVHGGVLMSIGSLAQRRAQLTDVSSAGTLRPLSVTADYLRPAPVDGAALVCRTDYVRRGRRYRTLRTEIVRPDQRVATVVTGLWAVLPPS